MSFHARLLPAPRAAITVPRKPAVAPHYRRWPHKAAGLALFFMAACFVLFRIFSGFKPWDDEGFILIGIRSLLQGHRLYDEVYAQYGPFFYLCQSLLYTLLGQNPYPTLERMIAAIFWLLSSGLLAYCIHRLLHSLICTMAAFVMTVRLLEFFVGSPGHPEELCMLLIAGLLVVACTMPEARSRPLVICASLFGFLVAALALTKINVGIFVAIAVALLLLHAASRSPLIRLARGVVSCLAVALPVMLMAPVLHWKWVQPYCATAAISILAVLIVAQGNRRLLLIRPPVIWIAVISFAATVLLTCGFYWLHGTTLKAMLDGIILQHLSYAQKYYIPSQLTFKSTIYATVSLSLAIVSRWAVGKPRLSLWCSFVLSALRCAVALPCILLLLAGDPGRLAHVIFAYLPPIVWLLLVAPDGPKAKTGSGRFALCLMAAFMFLYAFPVAGAQVGFASVPAGISAIVLLRDGIADMPPLPHQLHRFRAPRRIAAVVLPLAILGCFGATVLQAQKVYYRLVPLAFRDTQFIRVFPQDAALYHWIVRNLQPCQAIFPVPGAFSLYLWTGRTPPTLLDQNNVFGLLDDPQQESIIRDLKRHRGLCIVYSSRVADFWRRGQDLAAAPITRYIREQFKPIAENQGYIIFLEQAALIHTH